MGPIYYVLVSQNTIHELETPVVTEDEVGCFIINHINHIINTLPDNS